MEYTYTETGRKAMEKAEIQTIEKLRSKVVEQALRRGEPVEITQSDVESVMKTFHISNTSRRRSTEVIILSYGFVGLLALVGGLLFPVFNRIWLSGNNMIRISYLIALMGFFLLTFVGFYHLFLRTRRK